MLSKSPDILDKEQEFLVLALCFLQTPRTLLILLFISIYGIGSVHRIITTLDQAHLGAHRDFSERPNQQKMLQKKKTEPITINHFNTSNPKSKIQNPKRRSESTQHGHGISDHGDKIEKTNKPQVNLSEIAKPRTLTHKKPNYNSQIVLSIQTYISLPKVKFQLQIKDTLTKNQVIVMRN
jgi:hypothetical protein